MLFVVESEAPPLLGTQGLAGHEKACRYVNYMCILASVSCVKLCLYVSGREPGRERESETKT